MKAKYARVIREGIRDGRISALNARTWGEKITEADIRDEEARSRHEKNLYHKAWMHTFTAEVIRDIRARKATE